MRSHWSLELVFLDLTRFICHVILAAIWAKNESENLLDKCLKIWSRNTVKEKKRNSFGRDFGTFINTKIPAVKVTIATLLRFGLSLISKYAHLGNLVEMKNLRVVGDFL